METRKARQTAGLPLGRRSARIRTLVRFARTLPSETRALSDLVTADGVRLSAVIGVDLRGWCVVLADQIAADRVGHDFARVGVDLARDRRIDEAVAAVLF